MVKLEYTVLKAFTISPDHGNPAAVIILPAPSQVNENDPFSAYPPTPALQRVATHLNYPMTAFLLPLQLNEGKYALRWLDPGTEVQLCGHATVALSEYLFSLPGAPARLELETVKHGKVFSERLNNPLKEGDKRVALDFPEILGFRDIAKSTDEWETIEKGLKEVTRKEMPIVQLRRNDHYLIVELEAGFDMSAKGLPLDMEKLVRHPSDCMYRIKLIDRVISKDQVSSLPSLHLLGAQGKVHISILVSFMR
jgi:predicted PhzF superfamily epimerase YddE/YHI9